MTGTLLSCLALQTHLRLHCDRAALLVTSIAFGSHQGATVGVPPLLWQEDYT